MRSRRKPLSLFLFATALTILMLGASGCSPKAHEAVVVTIAKEPITLGEYENLYMKNNASREAGGKMTQEEREKFLDLVVKYRLKLMDAYAQHLDRRPEIMNELHQYKGSLAASFLTEREIVTPGVRRMFDQRNEEIRASHILLQMNRDASAADSSAAYARAAEIIEKLKQGAPFDSLALIYSQDPSARQNRGDLYYFTAGNMVAPFEQAAFAMKVGEFSRAPVRTQYGLHIIKIADRRPSPGEIRCSHIMAQFTKPNPPPEDTLTAYAKIVAIRDSLAMGVDFAELAKRNSGDVGSAGRGGDLGWFNRRRWVQPFDEAAFRLKPGELSPIVRSPYGYHLIKCTEARPRKTFDEAKDETKQLYQQARFQTDYNAYVGDLKKVLRYNAIDSVVARFIASCDSTKTTHDSAWTSGITPKLGRATMITINTGPITVDSVLALIKARPDLSNTPLRAAQILSGLEKIGDQVVFAARAETLEQENPEFAAILREYRDGILLYQIEQDQVWNRIAPSDSLLTLYFNEHRDRFVFPDRVNITEIRASNEDHIKRIQEMVRAGKTFESISADDSVRLTRPARYQLTFSRSTSALSENTKQSLSAVAAEVLSDPLVRIQLIAHPDTATRKSAQERLSARRLDAVSSYLTKELRVLPALITKQTTPIAPSLKGEKERLGASQIVEVNIAGRQPMVIGSLSTSLITVNSDERAKAVDTLAVGDHSSPFSFKGSWELVRLNSREPSRQKTYDEAAPEVSSAYQESESKRLEIEWLGGLRAKYPVVERKELLKNAFAPEH